MRLRITASSDLFLARTLMFNPNPAARDIAILAGNGQPVMRRRDGLAKKD
jgi:hypothetical protein